ncbi:hypothetical protein OUZ56_013895 [Daphnia magna]|uniref:Uncharacterized protein n=1 Tax=Daphnia magna TaxID=35525 RepID=A0ABQ9Z790_9CRUS|nr:hypothetical protein OUZ56_013895 [Daphnia magna]
MDAFQPSSPIDRRVSAMRRKGGRRYNFADVLLCCVCLGANPDVLQMSKESSIMRTPLDT